MAIWVDDGLVCGNNTTTIGEMLAHLNRAFKITSRKADNFVGLNIKRDRQNKLLYVSQPDYINKILTTFGMQNCRPRGTPADPFTRLTKKMSPADEIERENMASIPYREAIGSLIYAATTCRPDIAYAVSQVAQYCENPGKPHWEAVKRILAYLSITPDYGLRFDGAIQESLTLHGFTDSDYAGDCDNRRSTSGYVFTLNGGPIAWSSRRQDCVATSTTEAEYIAASEATKEAVWLRRLITQLGAKQREPTPIKCDNQSAIKLTKNPEYHRRTKHIDVRYHFVRHHQEMKNIEVSYVPTEDQVADILTKNLPGPRFLKLREDLGIDQTPPSTSPKK